METGPQLQLQAGAQCIPDASGSPQTQCAAGRRSQLSIGDQGRIVPTHKQGRTLHLYVHADNQSLSHCTNITNEEANQSLGTPPANWTVVAASAVSVLLPSTVCWGAVGALTQRCSTDAKHPCRHTTSTRPTRGWHTHKHAEHTRWGVVEASPPTTHTLHAAGCHCHCWCEQSNIMRAGACTTAATHCLSFGRTRTHYLCTATPHRLGNALGCQQTRTHAASRRPEPRTCCLLHAPLGLARRPSACLPAGEDRGVAGLTSPHLAAMMC